MSNIKQVIVVRKLYPDGKGGTTGARKGKLFAQSCHASLKIFTDKFTTEGLGLFELFLSDDEERWLKSGMTKICVSVDSEEELLSIHKQAQDKGLNCSLIKDAGLTEFSEPTYTCCAIGPNKSEEIDKITGKLKLL